MFGCSNASCCIGNGADKIAVKTILNKRARQINTVGENNQGLYSTNGQQKSPQKERALILRSGRDSNPRPRA